MSTIFAAHINSSFLTAQGIAVQTVYLAYMITQAISDVGNILIGHNIGGNKPIHAINMKNVVYTVATIFISLIAATILLSHRWLPYIFTSDETVIPLARNALLFVTIFNVVDGYTDVQTGIAKACGMQKYAAIVWFIGLYVVGLPLAYILTFKAHMNIYGFWIGMIVGETITCVMLFIALWRFDWYGYTEEVIDRIVSDPPLVVSQTPQPISSSTLKCDERLQLLSHQYDETTRTNLAAQNIELFELDGQSHKATSDQSLFNLIGLKLIILFPLICLFIISAVRNY